MLGMNDRVRLVIGVAGRIGSGKTVVARYLADRHGFEYLRYSIVLADWYKEDPEAKMRLQTVGWEVMSGEGQLELNRRLISRIDPAYDCAVDGLRHPIDFESLKNAFANSFFLVYIDTLHEIRFERLRNRYATYEEFLAADSHPVESHIQELVPLASATLNGAAPMGELGPQVDQLVRDFRVRSEGL